MKRWISVLLAVVILLSLTACATETEKNPYRLKTQTIDRYLVGELTSRMELDYTYTEEGYLSQIVYSLDGGATETYIHETDEYGNIIQLMIQYADGTTGTEDRKLTLDAQHRIIREESYWNGRLGSITEMAYDRNGNQTQWNLHRIQAGMEDNINWVDSVYDNNGNLISQTKRWNNGISGITKDNTTKVRRTQYEYQDGKCIRSETYNHKDMLVSYSEYTYDETGLVQTCQSYLADGSKDGKTINTYDEYGNLLTSEIYGAWDPVTESQDDLAERITTYTYERIAPEN